VYEKGQGVPQFDTDVARWYRKAADQGHALAQFNLDMIYFNGQGAQDAQEAEKWFRLAAKQGNAAVRLNLGVMYAKGRDVPQNAHEAAKWYRLAAEQGHSHALSNLGLMYAKTRGVSQDFVRAYMWHSVAADALSGDDGKDAIKSRDLSASQMTAAQIAKAQEMTRLCQQSKFEACN
jgi:TPR repeat protein